jgi:hypothetical protein
MAKIPNMFTILTSHVDGTPASYVNQAAIGGGSIPGQSRIIPLIRYIPTRNGLQQNVVVPNAAIVARIYIPEPLVGASTVTTISDDATGYTGGN